MTYDPRTYWPARAARQGASYVGPGGDPAKAAQQSEQFAEIIGGYLPAGNRVLDFGCGPGRLAPALLQKCPEYFGVDINRTGIEMAPMLPGASWLWMPGDAIPLPDASVDRAVAVTVFQHVVDDAELARWCAEIRRVVEPGGVVMVIDSVRLDKPSAHMRPRLPEDVGDYLGMHVINGGENDVHWVAALR